MTADEWEACLSGGQLLEAVRRYGRGPRTRTGRKLRLLASAVARRLTADEGIVRVVEEVERMADGSSAIPDVGFVARRAGVADHHLKNLLAALTDHDNFRSVKGVMFLPYLADRPPAPRVSLSEQAELLRDVFDNPFRPAAFDPRWLTSTTVALAGGMYDARDFAAMPILADALQDAGCENDRILSHCRDGGVHVRGCWVVDLVLGKS